MVWNKEVVFPKFGPHVGCPSVNCIPSHPQKAQTPKCTSLCELICMQGGVVGMFFGGVKGREDLQALKMRGELHLMIVNCPNEVTVEREWTFWASHPSWRMKVLWQNFGRNWLKLVKLRMLVRPCTSTYKQDRHLLVHACTPGDKRDV